MRQLLCALFFSVFGMASVAAQDLVFGISEGTSGGLDHGQVVNKYQSLADVIGKAIKRRVNVVFVREFAQLEEGMKVQRLDFVMARPSDYPARGLRDYGYQFVASAKPDGQCHIVVPKGSAITTLEQAKGKRWVMPEQVAFMSKFCQAALRDKGIVLRAETVQFVREQAAVGFYLENGFGDVGGVASYSGVAKGWETKGGKTIYKSVAQPYFPLIASSKLKPAQIAQVQAALQELGNSEAGIAIMTKTGVKGFDTESEARLRELLQWLEKK